MPYAIPVRQTLLLCQRCNRELVVTLNQHGLTLSCGWLPILSLLFVSFNVVQHSLSDSPTLLRPFNDAREPDVCRKARRQYWRRARKPASTPAGGRDLESSAKRIFSRNREWHRVCLCSPS